MLRQFFLEDAPEQQEQKPQPQPGPESQPFAAQASQREVVADDASKIKNEAIAPETDRVEAVALKPGEQAKRAWTDDPSLPPQSSADIGDV